MPRSAAARTTLTESAGSRVRGSVRAAFASRCRVSAQCEGTPADAMPLTSAIRALALPDPCKETESGHGAPVVLARAGL